MKKILRKLTVYVAVLSLLVYLGVNQPVSANEIGMTPDRDTIDELNELSGINEREFDDDENIGNNFVVTFHANDESLYDSVAKDGWLYNPELYGDDFGPKKLYNPESVFIDHECIQLIESNDDFLTDNCCFHPLWDSEDESAHEAVISCSPSETATATKTFIGTPTTVPSWDSSLSVSIIYNGCRYTGTLNWSSISSPYKNSAGNWCIDVSYKGTVYHQICVYK